MFRMLRNNKDHNKVSFFANFFTERGNLNEQSN